MATICTEEGISANTLMSHLTDCGLSSVPLNDNQIRLRTDSGIGFRITILKDKPFIYIGTFLPIDKVKSKEERLVFAHLLNSEIFLPVFSLDDDLDLTVSYAMSYQYGLIADQFTAVVQRFASLLDYLVGTFDTNGMFDFGAATVVTNEEQCLLQSPLSPDGLSIH